ncbi:hypothetical protein HDU97_005693 [Phlyctochytrium planicorne]|nr:hypothetical protein HDU97_005693 [Phlyctochytrium planicorne]
MLQTEEMPAAAVDPNIDASTTAEDDATHQSNQPDAGMGTNGSWVQVAKKTSAGPTKRSIAKPKTGSRRSACEFCRTRKFKCDGSYSGCEKRGQALALKNGSRLKLAPKLDSVIAEPPPPSSTATIHRIQPSPPFQMAATKLLSNAGATAAQVMYRQWDGLADSSAGSALGSAKGTLGKAASPSEATTQREKEKEKEKEERSLALALVSQPKSLVDDAFEQRIRNYLRAPSFKDPLEPLITLMDQVHISFSLDDDDPGRRRKPWTLSKHLESGGTVLEALQGGIQVDGRKQYQQLTGPLDFDDRSGIGVQRLILEKYLRGHACFPMETVHRKTFLETLHLQPPVLRYAMCALCAHLSLPQAPKDVYLAFFNKAKSLFHEIVEECTIENFQAAMMLSFCSSAMSDIQFGFVCLSAAIRMAEYLKLFEDPDEDPQLSKLPWEAKETRRRFICVMSGMPSIMPRDDVKVLPLCDDRDFLSLTPPLTVLPHPESPVNRANELVALGHRIQQTIGMKPYMNLDELEAVRPQLVSEEAALMDWYRTLPESLSREPTEEVLEEYLRRGTYSTAFGMNYANAKEGESQIRSEDLGVYLFIQTFYNCLRSLLQRPRLLLYGGNYRLPNSDGYEARSLLQAIAVAEESTANVATLCSRLARVSGRVAAAQGMISPLAPIESSSHPFSGFPIMISSMTLIDIVAVKRRLEVVGVALGDLSLYILQTHASLSEMQKVMLAATRYWNVGGETRKLLPELMDLIVDCAKVEAVPVIPPTDNKCSRPNILGRPVFVPGTNRNGSEHGGSDSPHRSASDQAPSTQGSFESPTSLDSFGTPQLSVPSLTSDSPFSNQLSVPAGVLPGNLQNDLSLTEILSFDFESVVGVRVGSGFGSNGPMGGGMVGLDSTAKAFFAGDDDEGGVPIEQQMLDPRATLTLEQLNQLGGFDPLVGRF